MVDHKVRHGLMDSFELEAKLFLHRGEDRRPALWIVRGPVSPKLKRVIVEAGETRLVDDGHFHHRTQNAGDPYHGGIRYDELEAMLRSMRLIVSGWTLRRCLSLGGSRRRGHNLHFDAAFAYDEVIDGAIASFKMG